MSLHSSDQSLVVLQVTPALDAGGVERTTLEIAEAIVKAGGRALVASRGGRLEPELASLGGELFPMPLESKNPLVMFANARRIAALAKREGVRIIHARSRAPAWSALFAARWLKLPFVTTYHGVYNGRRGLKRFYNSVMARGDIVIANSLYTRAHVQRVHHMPDNRLIAIPRAVDLTRFSPMDVGADRVAAMRAHWRIAPDDIRPILLAPARLTRWKGQGLFLEAAARLNEERPGAAHFVIAGDAQGRDAYVRELEDFISHRGLTGLAHIVGHLTDMPAALAAARVAVFPTTDPEAFGRAAIEAQAMGVPVLAAAHGGFTETIRDGETGFLVPPGEAQALHHAMRRVLDMTDGQRSAIGQTGAAHVRQIYSVAALQTATLDVYRRLLGYR